MSQVWRRCLQAGGDVPREERTAAEGRKLFHEEGKNRSTEREGTVRGWSVAGRGERERIVPRTRKGRNCSVTKGGVVPMGLRVKEKNVEMR